MTAKRRNRETGSRVGWPHGVTPGRLSYALRLPCAPGKYRANSAYNPRWLRERRFSTPSGLARLSRHKQEYATRFQLSSSTCASLREASQRHRRALLSSILLIQAEKPPSPFPHSYTPLFILISGVPVGDVLDHLPQDRACQNYSPQPGI